MADLRHFSTCTSVCSIITHGSEKEKQNFFIFFWNRCNKTRSSCINLLNGWKSLLFHTDHKGQKISRKTKFLDALHHITLALSHEGPDTERIFTYYNLTAIRVCNRNEKGWTRGKQVQPFSILELFSDLSGSRGSRSSALRVPFIEPWYRLYPHDIHPASLYLQGAVPEFHRTSC